jgi:nucleoside-diphosphate-sugar epimerase
MVGENGTTVGGVDVCDAEALKSLFREHADENTTVWNLAAPLSVETAMDPAVAEAVTVGGMGKVLDAMNEVGARRICFTDSIGSYGSAAPRSGTTARWLTENPGQDPGSDYGRQKRGCRYGPRATHSTTIIWPDLPASYLPTCLPPSLPPQGPHG